MKNTFFAIAIFAISLSACNNSNDKSNESEVKSEVKSNDTTQATPQAQKKEAKSTLPMKEIVSSYLQLKNALANDNGKDAATAGNATMDAIGKVDETSFTADEKKVYGDLADDAKEMAEHIGKNADKLEHQREHFDMLSTDVYDMVKKFGAGQTLYKDFCPMYNNKKGAIWLSETKEIKNPYLGKKMPNCGSVKEELK